MLLGWLGDLAEAHTEAGRGLQDHGRVSPGGSLLNLPVLIYPLVYLWHATLYQKIRRPLQRASSVWDSCSLLPSPMSKQKQGSQCSECIQQLSPSQGKSSFECCVLMVCCVEAWHMQPISSLACWPIWNYAQQAVHKHAASNAAAIISLETCTSSFHKSQKLQASTTIHYTTQMRGTHAHQNRNKGHTCFDKWSDNSSDTCQKEQVWPLQVRICQYSWKSWKPPTQLPNNVCKSQVVPLASSKNRPPETTNKTNTKLFLVFVKVDFLSPGTHTYAVPYGR